MNKNLENNRYEDAVVAIEELAKYFYNKGVKHAILGIGIGVSLSIVIRVVAKRLKKKHKEITIETLIKEINEKLATINKKKQTEDC